LVISKNIGIATTVSILVMSEALFSEVPRFPPEFLEINFDSANGDFTEFQVGSLVGHLVSLQISTTGITPSDPTPAELLELLSDTLGALNLDRGTANSLDSKLDAVLSALLDPKRKDNKAAINQLSAFINSVKAVSGKKMTSGQADDLILQAQAIIAALSS
jgi:hypothetical protein